MATTMRPKARQPDKTTAEGQCALYLAHLLAKHGKSADDLAEGIGKGRAVVFRYLNGDTALTLPVMQAIADYLQLDDWRELIPPTRFLRTLQ